LRPGAVPDRPWPGTIQGVTDTVRTFLVPDDVAAGWGMTARLDVGDVEAWLLPADRQMPWLTAVQAEVLGVNVTDVDVDGRLGRGRLRFEPWRFVAVPAAGHFRLGLRVTSIHGPTGWSPDDPDADSIVRAALAAHVHPKFSNAAIAELV
jgi:hypothetical protein